MSDERLQPRLRVRFNGVRRGLNTEEAMILADWLGRWRTLAAPPLAVRIEAHIAADDSGEMELEHDEVVSIKQVLADVDLEGKYPGLKLLQKTLMGYEET
jgi:hypothetical protein